MKRTSILLVALLALVVAACSSGEASPSASPSEPAAIQETPEPTESEADEPSEAPEASGSITAIPSFDLNGDPELAARFPDTIGGEPLQVLSMRADDPMMAGSVDASFQDFLDATGAELEDVSVAFGGSADPESGFGVFAFRVLGVAEDRLEAEFLASSEEAGDITGLTQVSVGGKDVWAAQDMTGASDGMAYIYVKDDTVYFMTGTEEQAAEILAALP
ncbi:MAG: hypothetical protein ACRDG7_04070 [Candidatus Limnocylindria bacterium]